MGATLVPSIETDTVSIKEKAAASVDTAAYGQFWVKTATPNVPMFTDDAGTDFKLSGGYSIQAQQGNLSTVPDSTTYYFGSVVNSPGTGGGVRKLFIPATGTIKRIDLFALSTNASSENFTYSLRLNDTTDTTITTTADFSSMPYTGGNSNLSIAVTAGDFVEIKFVTPVWTTNPTFLTQSANIWIEQ